MKRSKVWRSIFVLAILLPLTGRLGLAQGPTAVENGIQAALGTGFTYQGRLTDNGSPANGVYDFRFILYDDPSAGSAVAPAIYADEKSVTGGLFSVTLNFGDVFGGQARYLGIGVRPGASGDVYQTLTPRQELTAAPYALYALDAGAHSHWGDSWAGAGTGLTLTSSNGNGVLGKASVTGYGVRGESADGAGVEGESGFGAGVYGKSAYGYGVHGEGYDGLHGTTGKNAGRAVYGENTGGGYGIVGVTNSGSGYAAVSGSNSGSGRGVYGGSAAGVGVFGHSGSSSDAGVSGSNDSAGPGVYGHSNTGPGVYGHSLYDDQAGVYGRHNFYGYGVFGESAGGPGVYGLSYSSSDAGVYGKNTSGSGVAGASSSSSEAGVTGSNDSTGPGVYGTSAGNYGVRGEGDDGGVYGRSTGDISAGVHGESNYGPGVEGYSVLDQGVHGESDEGIGVYGASPIGYGVYGDSSDGYAGYFAGDVHVEGELTKLAGSFKIDHPLDPQNRYLSHSFVESPDMMNIYNGNTILDGDGAAWVELPAWFEALNGGEEHRSEFRYQLTPIGTPGPNLYIAAEIADNRFRIAGGTPGMKVSWQVTAIRHDPYAETHRIPVEEAKPAEERGTCLYPEACGRPAPAGLGDMVQPPGGAE